MMRGRLYAVSEKMLHCVQMVYGGRYFIVWVGGRDEPYAKIDFE